MFEANYTVVGRKNFSNNLRKIDYYLRYPTGEMLFLFTKNYSFNTYNLCKGGVRINDLLTKKSKDVNIMKLVNHLNRFESYLKYEYEVA